MLCVCMIIIVVVVIVIAIVAFFIMQKDPKKPVKSETKSAVVPVVVWNILTTFAFCAL